MPRFLIEVEHEAETVACAKVVQAFLQTGSHFLTHADWGCKDGDHRCWIITEVDTREEALWIVPPAFRPQTKVVRLNYFQLDQIEKLLKHHGG